MKHYSFIPLVKHHLFRNIRKNYLKKIQHFSSSGCLCNDKLTGDDSGQQTDLKEPKDIFQAPKEKSKLSYFVPEKDRELVERLKKGDIFYPYNDPLERAYKIFLQDMVCTRNIIMDKLFGFKLGDLEVKYFPRHTDILVVGSSPLGLLFAYEMRSKFPYGPSVIVLDVEEKNRNHYFNLGQGILSQQMFNDEIEIEMTQYCAKFLSSFHIHAKVMNAPTPNVAYDPLGTLVLANDGNAEEVIKKTQILKEKNADCRLLEPEMLKKKFPWLNIDGISFGRLGMVNEGTFDPWAFLDYLRGKLINLGVTFVKAQAIDFGPSGDETPMRLLCRLPDGTYNSINFCFCVITAGMESINLSEKLFETKGYFKLPFPLERRMRFEYCFHSSEGPCLNTPTIVDPDGTYFRRDGLVGHYVAGVPSVPADGNEQNTLYNVFENKVKPFLTKRVPQFEKLELVNGWVDTYDYNTVNKVGLIGHHPQNRAIVFANGFANHGLQYAPAIGRGLAESILYGKYQTIDLSCFSFENLYRKQHLEADKKKRELLKNDERIALHE